MCIASCPKTVPRGQILKTETSRMSTSGIRYITGASEHRNSTYLILQNTWGAYAVSNTYFQNIYKKNSQNSQASNRDLESCKKKIISQYDAAKKSYFNLTVKDKEFTEGVNGVWLEVTGFQALLAEHKKWHNRAGIELNVKMNNR